MQTVAQLDSFVHEVFERGRFRPALGSVVHTLLGGIAAAGSVVLSEVLRPQVQKEDLHAAEQRVSHALKNEAALDALPDVYLAMVAEAARSLRFRTVDGSDVSKPAGRKFEHLDIVRDGSSKPRDRVVVGGPKGGNPSTPPAPPQAHNERKRAQGRKATSRTIPPALPAARPRAAARKASKAERAKYPSPPALKKLGMGTDLGRWCGPRAVPGCWPHGS